MNISFYSCGIGAALGVFALAGPAAALSAPTTSFTALSYTSANYSNNSSAFSLGYSFTTGMSALNVTAVGYLNDDGSTSQDPHSVQIYQITSGGVLNPVAGTAVLASPVSVTTSIGAAPFDTFSYTALSSPVTLLADTAYEIVGTDNGNGFASNAQGAVFSGITYGTSTYAYATTAVFNSSTYSNNDIGNIGPNFQYTVVAPVPEASSMVSLGLLLTAGLAGLAAARRKSAKG